METNNTAVNDGIFRLIILNTAPRILGFGNRDRDTGTCGCFDRNFWHYRLIDFPNSRFQEAALFLALLYTREFDGNRYYHNAKVLEWLEACIAYWSVIQIRDGSFNEYYPFERSFVATAFTSFAVSEALLLMNIERCIPQLKKAGDWLMKHVNPHVANQNAGALTALYNIYTITGEQKYLDGCRQKIEQLARMRQPEGFFREYGGCDIGYSSILLSYLTLYGDKAGDTVIKGWISSLQSYLEPKIDTLGTYDHHTTSRQTQYLYPYSFARFDHPIFERYMHGMRECAVLSPLWMDDRFCIPLANDVLMTYLHGRGEDS